MDDLAIWLAEVEWSGCADRRPWLQVDERVANIFGCFPFASHCYEGRCFQVRSADADFAATGLDRDCYIHAEHLYEVHDSDLIKRIGFLRGRLLERFREHAGL